MAAVTTLTLRIMGEFTRDVRSSHTIRQLAQQTKTPYPNVHATVTALLKNNILTKLVVGHSHLCSLNLQNEEACLLIGLWHAQQRHDSPNRIKQLSNEPNILVIVRRPEDTLILTQTPEQNEFSGETWTSIHDLSKNELATLGKHPILHGHAALPYLLRRHL